MLIADFITALTAAETLQSSVTPGSPVGKPGLLCMLHHASGQPLLHTGMQEQVSANYLCEFIKKMSARDQKLTRGCQDGYTKW